MMLEIMSDHERSPMRIVCPACRTPYRIDPSRIKAGQGFARCGKCRTRFSLKKKRAAPPPPSTGPPLLACRNCDRIIGRLEKAHRFREHLVCAQCLRRLQGDAHPVAPDGKPGEKEPPKRKATVSRGNGNGASGSLLDAFRGMLSEDLAIDLGTANTLIYMKRRGIVLNESSVVVVRTDMTNGKRVLAVGADARNMIGKTPANVAAIRPMRDGVIADFEVAGAMLERFIGKVRTGFRFIKPRMVIAVPSGITPVERRAVRESALGAGAKEVFLIEEPMAAAIGANLPVTEPACNMVVDIGGGTTEVAVISLGGIVASRSIKIAGDEMDEAIVRYVKRAYNFIIGERTAEEIKIAVGNADPDTERPDSIEVKGWEIFSGRPKILALNALEVREAISDQLAAILETIRIVLDKTPQELAAGVIDHGIVLTGGVALLKNLGVYLARESGIPMTVADDPLSTIVMGSGKALDNPRLFSQAISARSPRADR